MGAGVPAAHPQAIAKVRSVTPRKRQERVSHIRRIFLDSQIHMLEFTLARRWTERSAAAHKSALRHLARSAAGRHPAGGNQLFW